MEARLPTGGKSGYSRSSWNHSSGFTYPFDLSLLRTYLTYVSSPMQWCSSALTAKSEWPLSKKAAVASEPANSNIISTPPGCCKIIHQKHILCQNIMCKMVIENGIVPKSRHFITSGSLQRPHKRYRATANPEAIRWLWIELSRSRECQPVHSKLNILRKISQKLVIDLLYTTNTQK